jgi:photosystem II stability/assembly factor-like uncharacterized protein
MARALNIALAFALLSIALPFPAFAASSLQKPAATVAFPQHAPLLAATHAGRRIVAVGDHGVVLLSDDDGRRFRQARAVPTQALLDTVFFSDARRGWAAGHDGVILHSEDGGETWTLQREDIEAERPLFSIHFLDAQRGFAVGLFGTAVRTDDGGRSWQPFHPQAGNDEDRHLYAVFGGDGKLFIAAEAGLVYRSNDGGISWQPFQTSNAGSFWCGAYLGNGNVLVAGQSGHIFRSENDGAGWAEIPSTTRQSLTAIEARSDGAVLVAGLAGVTLTSRDGGRHFESSQRSDRAPLTAVVTSGADGHPVFFGSGGVVGGPR